MFLQQLGWTWENHLILSFWAFVVSSAKWLVFLKLGYLMACQGIRKATEHIHGQPLGAFILCDYSERHFKHESKYGYLGELNAKSAFVSKLERTYSNSKTWSKLLETLGICCYSPLSERVPEFETHWTRGWLKTLSPVTWEVPLGISDKDLSESLLTSSAIVSARRVYFIVI